MYFFFLTVVCLFRLKRFLACFVTSAEREVNDSRREECFKVASGGPEVASELFRDLFEFFDLFFQAKEIIMRTNYFFWKK